ncbi:hypothetical protein EYF80_044099 [Liparis tanakae]|uniref:Uncharacterized protein n=1 Tax=Liparis tanakae TaxID=230148 RepID=A0A4Z2FWP8_9TELE|nr:hypothetical protein EYF80_044099 [Liparis tanakae]
MPSDGRRGPGGEAMVVLLPEVDPPRLAKHRPGCCLMAVVINGQTVETHGLTSTIHQADGGKEEWAGHQQRHGIYKIF